MVVNLFFHYSLSKITLGLLPVKPGSSILPRLSRENIQVRISYTSIRKTCPYTSLAPDIHWAIVTVAGIVDGENEHFSSEKIAQNYWNLYVQPRADWQTEVIH